MSFYFVSHCLRQWYTSMKIVFRGVIVCISYFSNGTEKVLLKDFLLQNDEGCFDDVVLTSVSDEVHFWIQVIRQVPLLGSHHNPSSHYGAVTSHLWFDDDQLVFTILLLIDCSMTVPLDLPICLLLNPCIYFEWTGILSVFLCIGVPIFYIKIVFGVILSFYVLMFIKRKLK